MKPLGYRSAVIGKWHLGHVSEYWPTRRGFDYYYGLPYSNDMRPLALYRGEKNIEEPVEQSTLTERYTDEVLRFIEKSGEQPFFIYLAHTFPHIPLHASRRFSGRSRAGLYGDVVETIDWSTGRIIEALGRLGLARNTLVIFTSDNGAWFEGSNGPYRQGKGTTWDGGYRVPFLAWWPARIPGGARSDAMAMNIDLLPTLAALTGAQLPAGYRVDGLDIWPLLQGGGQSPHEVLYFFDNEEIAAVRTPGWKLLVRAYYRRNLAAFDRFAEGVGFAYWPLYDMRAQEPERYSQAREHPEVLAKMRRYLAAGRQEFEPLRTYAPAVTVPARRIAPADR